MALLNKLCVRGIRSFGPDDEEKITFSTPLTLILGQNGCGKTTIIECLKYGLTSDLPAGSDSGRGFINDPKLSNRSSTKGCIKIKFTDPQGDRITVGKFVEVTTQAGGKLKFKSLNPSVRWEDAQGHIEDIAGRCVDIDVYCTQKLNVSKAIINNVIFCHQENSSWPLDEAKKLKEKFDEIFGSTEYNKCVERFRKVIKDKGTSIKVLREQLEFRKMAKRNTEKLRETLSGKETQLENIHATIKDKQKQIEPLQKKLNEINELVDTLSTTRQKLTSLETTLKGVLDHQDSIKKHLEEEYEGTDEDLNDEMLNFNNSKEAAINDISQKNNKKAAIESKLEEIKQVVQTRQILYGQLKQEESEHFKRLDELKDLIEKCKVKFEVVAEDEEPIPDILEKLNTAFKEGEITFNEHRKNVEKKESEAQAHIDGIREKHAAAVESRSFKMKQIDDTNTNMKEMILKLSRLSYSNTQMDNINKRITEAEEALEEKKTEFNSDVETKLLEELDAEVTKKEDIQSKLEREHRILQNNYLTQQNIDSEKNLIAEKSNEVANLKRKHEQHFQTLFEQDVQLGKYEETIFGIQKKEEHKVKQITNSISSTEKKIASLEVLVKHIAEKLRQHKEDLTRDKSKITNACKGKDFLDILNQSYEKKEKLQKEKGAYRSAKTLFEQFISQFEQESPCCPICATDFSSKRSAVSNIINTLKKKIEDLPRKLTETENSLKKEEEFYNKLQQLKPASENVKILEDVKIPLLDEELQQNEEKLNETKMTLASLKNDLIEPQNLVETCRKTISDAAFLDRLSQEIKKSEDLVESLKQELATVASKRTLSQTETELSKVRSEILNSRKEYKTKREFIDEANGYMRRLNNKLQFETQKKLELQKSLQEQPLLEKQIEDGEKAILQYEEEHQKLIEKVCSLKEELTEAQRSRNEMVQDNKRELDECRLNLDQRKRLIQDVEKLYNIIKKYEKGDSKTKLENTLRELEEYKISEQKLDQTKNILIQDIEKNKTELANQESKFRLLSDNKDLRISRGKSKELEHKIRDLKKQIGHHNSASICEERSKVMREIDLIQSEISCKVGEQKQIKKMIEDFKSELNKKEHKESVNEYKKKFYEFRVEELAVKDLEVYTEALEKSILKFHKERMVQINMTIRELWRNIYKGNDIDYIEIQTVDDIGSGGARKRSYNYKVVEVKKGVELEMRGRCSAGQKVLACLIIRMALAETFSANCGIFALDEPTTNLDRNNIMSLSDALSRIITSREQQKNFQLIIITHDEEFLQTLTRDQSVSHYYRVQRDTDGFSEIKKEVL